MEEHWRWRMRMAKHLAAELDAEKFGVVALYLFGSTKNATAGPGSDIDLLVHFRGTPEQESELRSWLGAWSQRLAEMNYQRTGNPSEGLLDVHLITDDDIAQRTSYAVKIGATTDAAMLLPTKKSAK
jgi:predicted nucleotidyltransferase